MKSQKSGTVKKKIILLLAGYLALGLSYSLKQQIWILKQIGREWNWINRRALERAIKSLYESKMIEIKDYPGGSTRIILSDNGKKKILEYKIDELKINKPKKWDQKWRIVIFDIPEEYKKIREAVRGHLKRLGFYK